MVVVSLALIEEDTLDLVTAFWLSSVWEPTEVYRETCSHNTPLLITTPVI